MSIISKLPPEWWKDNASKDSGSNCSAGSTVLATSAPCPSSASRSADEWASLGRKAANLAMDATEAGNHGTAEQHRKTAMMAFEMEVRLRGTPNDQALRPADTEKGT